MSALSALALPPELFIALGVAASLTCAEMLRLSPGGVIVPGYLALCLTRPAELGLTLAAALAAFLFVKAASRLFYLFGRRRFALSLLAGLAAVSLLRAFFVPAAGGDGAFFRYGGSLVPGILAAVMAKQGALKTAAAAAAVTLLVFAAASGAGAGLAALSGAEEKRAQAEYAASLERLERQGGLLGEEYTPLTTTLGSREAKEAQYNSAAACLMTRLLKQAGARAGAKVAVNASGSFPGLLFATLAACRERGVEVVLVVSLGASSYGANRPGWTVADMLFAEGVAPAAITPGGTDDAGREIDEAELERVAALAQSRAVPFIRPQSLSQAAALREEAFAGCAVLVNIGGNHPSAFADAELAARSGLLRPTTRYAGRGLIGEFLSQGKPVIQVLNIRRLFRQFGIEPD